MIIKEIMEDKILWGYWKTGYCGDNGRQDVIEIMDDQDIRGDNGRQYIT